MPRVIVATDQHDQWEMKCLLPDGSKCGEWIVIFAGERPYQPVVTCSGCHTGFYAALQHEEGEAARVAIERRRSERVS